MDDATREALDAEIAVRWRELDELEREELRITRGVHVDAIPPSERHADIRELLAIPRPRVRGDCVDGPRPCPWVGCRHHLLLEVAHAKPRKGRDARPTVIRLNSREARSGRRGGVPPGSSEATINAWIEAALDLLVELEHTCALDVVDAYPEGIAQADVGWLIGIAAHQSIGQIEREACARLREAEGEIDLEPYLS